MLTISAKGIYGLIAVYELALNYHKGPIQIKDISEKQAIPQHYLEQLLLILKKSGLVKSFRGKFGGYTLSKDPLEIKVLDVLEYLEGRVDLVKSNDRLGILNFFWDDLEECFRKKLNISIKDIILKKRAYENKIDYVI